MPYPKSPSGMPGTQTIGLIMTDYYLKGKITVNQLVELLCINPCKIFGIKNRGEIKVGNLADLTIYKLNKKFIWVNSLGIVGNIFCDFLNHKTFDLDGEELSISIIDKIENNMSKVSYSLCYNYAHYNCYYEFIKKNSYYKEKCLYCNTESIKYDIKHWWNCCF